MNDNIPNKCDYCGKFISWDDIDKGYAVNKIHPDNEFHYEYHELICKRCNK